MDFATVLVTALAVLLGGQRLIAIVRGPPNPLDPVTVEDWRTYGERGHRIGSASAPVQIVEFSDFQCPFCRVAHKDLADLLTEYPEEVAVVYRHFPLRSIHEYALDAALASECAAAQDRFQAFHDLLFVNQDRFGKDSWSEFADRAGVPRLDTFEACLATGQGAAIVSRDTLAARRLGLQGTPGILVNDQLVGGNPGIDRLRVMVQSALGKVDAVR